MERLNLTELRELAQPKRSPCVSIYLDAKRVGEAPARDGWDAMLRWCDDSCSTEWRVSDEVQALLNSLQVYEPGDGRLSRAVFLAPGFCRVYMLNSPVQTRFEVSGEFFLKPLLAVVIESHRSGLSRGKTLAKFHRAAGMGQTIEEAGEVLRAASRGELTAVYVRPDVDEWGRFDPGSGHTERHDDARPGDSELANLACVLALRRHREVVCLTADECPDVECCAGVGWLPRLCAQPEAGLRRFSESVCSSS